MDENWNKILISLKEMFHFDDDILWSIYFNNNMNLEKTINNLLEISKESEKLKENQNIEPTKTDMISFEEIKDENNFSNIFSKIKLSLVNRNSKKYNKIDNDLED